MEIETDQEENPDAKRHCKCVLIVIQGDIGLNVAQMIVELIRDNRKIVDRITKEQIEMFVGLLCLNKVTTVIEINNPCQRDGIFFSSIRKIYILSLLIYTITKINKLP